MTPIFIVAIVFGSAVTIVRMAFQHNEKILQHNENIERIKHGYPLLTGEHPTKTPDVPKIPQMKEPDIIDYTNNRQQ